MNLNHVTPIYSKAEHAIILLDSRPELVTFGRRIVQKEVMDALVQYMSHEDPPFRELTVNSMGKNYILRVTQCK